MRSTLDNRRSRGDSFVTMLTHMTAAYRYTSYYATPRAASGGIVSS